MRLCAGAPVLRPGQSQRWLDAVRGRRMRRLLDGGHYKVNWEFIITIPDSSFTLRALACVERAR
eukprot:scaffold37330_cov64-Phaeocystis_antarctica.AAC.1